MRCIKFLLAIEEFEEPQRPPCSNSEEIAGKSDKQPCYRENKDNIAAAAMLNYSNYSNYSNFSSGSPLPY